MAKKAKSAKKSTPPPKKNKTGTGAATGKVVYDDPVESSQDEDAPVLLSNEELDQRQGLPPLPQLPATAPDFTEVEGADELVPAVMELVELDAKIEGLLYTDTPPPAGWPKDKPWDRRAELKLAIETVLKDTRQRAIKVFDDRAVWMRGSNSQISKQRLVENGVSLATIAKSTLTKRYDYVQIKSNLPKPGKEAPAAAGGPEHDGFEGGE